MSCQGKAEHTWPRGGWAKAGSTVRAGERRDVLSCNDCLAIKVRFQIHQGDGSTKEAESIVEPPEDSHSRPNENGEQP